MAPSKGFVDVGKFVTRLLVTVFEFNVFEVWLNNVVLFGCHINLVSKAVAIYITQPIANASAVGWEVASR